MLTGRGSMSKSLLLPECQAVEEIEGNQCFP
jgi:hypothetical protein